MNEDVLISGEPPATTYFKLFSYFKGKNFREKLWRVPCRIFKAEEPSLIQGRVYWIDITVEIAPKNGGSEVRLSFDFRKHFTELIFLANFIAIVFLIFLCAIFKDFSLFEGALIPLLVFDVVYLAMREKNEKGIKKKILVEISKVLQT